MCPLSLLDNLNYSFHLTLPLGERARAARGDLTLHSVTRICRGPPRKTADKVRPNQIGFQRRCRTTTETISARTSTGQYKPGYPEQQSCNDAQDKSIEINPDYSVPQPLFQPPPLEKNKITRAHAHTQTQRSFFMCGRLAGHRVRPCQCVHMRQGNDVLTPHSAFSNCFLC